ncbi:hypothetical protein EX30DRAFT_341281 [Ascodesmis nigricans]|uniref:Uncharacterized protein n=1 Tax=Ascodesmis nigricans TaxID=341454 RepID=A0A4S2MVI3_9PEZI|nr:hypothetical protein EX30DRAFT_341281 [Ascodesmis nigricans]
MSTLTPQTKTLQLTISTPDTTKPSLISMKTMDTLKFAGILLTPPATHILDVHPPTHPHPHSNSSTPLPPTPQPYRAEQAPTSGTARDRYKSGYAIMKAQGWVVPRIVDRIGGDGYGMGVGMGMAVMPVRVVRREG